MMKQRSLHIFHVNKVPLSNIHYRRTPYFHGMEDDADSLFHLQHRALTYHICGSSVKGCTQQEDAVPGNFSILYDIPSLLMHSMTSVAHICPTNTGVSSTSSYTL